MAHATTAPLTIVLPGLKLLSESNLREHWAQRHRRGKQHRSIVFYSLMAEVPRALATSRPLTITITRIAGRLLDEGDNLPGSSCKHKSMADTEDQENYL